jgi:hypothetical protein
MTDNQREKTNIETFQYIVTDLLKALLGSSPVGTL